MLRACKKLFVPPALPATRLHVCAALPTLPPSSSPARQFAHAAGVDEEDAAPVARAPILSNTAKVAAAKAARLKRARAKATARVVKAKSGPVYPLLDALRLVKAAATASFDETVEVQIATTLDPRKPGQAVRGTAVLPHGSGVASVIAVFAKGEKAEEARAAGADIVGGEELVEAVGKGVVGFSKAIATPDMMALVGRVARVLGPRGLMPNPRLGTVTTAVKEAVAAARRGQAEFRVEKNGVVAAGFGKASFTVAALADNYTALLSALNDAKPVGVKGVLVQGAAVKSTQGVSVGVEVNVKV